MKKIFRRGLSFLLAAILLLGLGAECFAEGTLSEFTDLSFTLPGDPGTARLAPQNTSAGETLFLPSQTACKALTVHFTPNNTAAEFTAVGALGTAELSDGASLDLPALCGAGDRFELTLRAAVNELACERRLTVICTDGIASMYLKSDDPVGHGREWVESKKSNKATGTMLMLDAAGEAVYDGKLTQIKGRGNSTWLQAKKPYQIKLKEKTDLLQSGEKANANKTWILLANAVDASLLRNQIVYTMAEQSGLACAVQCRPVNLYYDGEYRGAYLLSEKVEINKGRVNIHKLEDDFETANPDVTDFDALSVATDVTANGATYVYCEGLNTPADYSGGYLLEMDTKPRAEAEKCYFRTKHNQYVVVKSPEFCSKDAMAYIAGYYQEYEDAIYGHGTNPETGKPLSDYVDLESVAQCYLVNEVTKNLDTFRSSAYLYKDTGESVMKMGPIWDYDLCLGTGGEYPTGFYSLLHPLVLQLYQYGDFRVTVREVYENRMHPIIGQLLSEKGTALASIAELRDTLAPSAAANAVLWGGTASLWNERVDDVAVYLRERDAFLTEAYSSWNGETADPIAAKEYSDVRPDDWYFDNIMLATNAKLFGGMPDGSFHPNDNATRAEATKVLYSISGETVSGEGYGFNDTAADAWYMPAILWAKQSGVVNGYEDGSFRPENPITREEFAVLLYRMSGSPAVEAGDAVKACKDFDQVSLFARDAMTWAVENQIIRGYLDSTVQPLNSITRAELATMILRYYRQFVEQ